MKISWFRTFAMAFAAGLFLSAAPSVWAYKVAVIMNPKRHTDEFDYSAEVLEWEMEKIPYTVDNMKQLTDRLEEFDLLLVSPLFPSPANPVSPSDLDLDAILRFIENGGGLIMTDGSYDFSQEFVNAISDKLTMPGTYGCTSSQWVVEGYLKNEEPVHMTRVFPNVMNTPDTWGHFQNPGPFWRVLARCSQGKPVILEQRLGKGFVIMTNSRLMLPEPLENYETYHHILQSGLDVDKISITELKPGPGRLDIQTATPPPMGTKVALRIVDGQNKAHNYTASFSGNTCTLNYVLEARGPSVAEIYFQVEGTTHRILRKKVYFPQLLEVGPPAYRGMISTERRERDVDFQLRFAPAKENLADANVFVAVFDDKSNQVARARARLPREPIEELWVPVALPKELQPGTYTFKGILSVPNTRIRKLAETTFEIVAPMETQVLIDEDGTFLVNGKPYFPLGIYHTDSEYEKIASIGFNAAQFWKWQDDGKGGGLSKALDHGLMSLFESNHGVWPELVHQYKNKPGVLMWYVSDEPDESGYPRSKKNYNIWRENDPNHPTFICCCRKDLFGLHKENCDVLGFNPGGKKYIDSIIEFIKLAREQTGGRQSLVLVPGAMSESAGERCAASAYAAITQDIRGIFWYCWKQTGGGPVGIGLCQHEDNQAAFAKLLTELKQLIPALTSTGRRRLGEGPVYGLLCPNLKPGERMLILFNSSEEPQQFNLRIPEMERSTRIMDAFTKELTQISSGIINRSFEPFERVVYRW